MLETLFDCTKTWWDVTRKCKDIEDVLTQVNYPRPKGRQWEDKKAKVDVLALKRILVDNMMLCHRAWYRNEIIKESWKECWRPLTQIRVFFKVWSRKKWRYLMGSMLVKICELPSLHGRGFLLHGRSLPKVEVSAPQALRVVPTPSTNANPQHPRDCWMGQRRTT